MFQSTRPRRGATRYYGCDLGDAWGFNPRAPEGARHGNTVEAQTDDGTFQSTRPRRGATWDRLDDGKRKEKFLSTRPRRGATSFSALANLSLTSFNPRAPEGARRPGSFAGL